MASVAAQDELFGEPLRLRTISLTELMTSVVNIIISVGNNRLHVAENYSSYVFLGTDTECGPMS